MKFLYRLILLFIAVCQSFLLFAADGKKKLDSAALNHPWVRPLFCKISATGQFMSYSFWDDNKKEELVYLSDSSALWSKKLGSLSSYNFSKDGSIPSCKYIL